jgi:AraC-like DNA-binding protein
LRLDQARQQLLHAAASTSVTDVAARCGFNHLGRFAAWYRHRYGESPSATLRRREGALAGEAPVAADSAGAGRAAGSGTAPNQHLASPHGGANRSTMNRSEA